jgi:hypothetical protein
MITTQSSFLLIDLWCLTPLNPITLGDAYWEHQQLQKQINEQTKKAQLYAGFDMNATFDQLFNQSKWTHHCRLNRNTHVI